MVTTPTLESAYSRALTYAERLVESLEDLDDCGGLSAVRATMRPSSSEKLAEALALVRSLADHQLATLNRRPARPTLLRRQANKPAPITVR
jgi:hypothetical protein